MRFDAIDPGVKYHAVAQFYASELFGLDFRTFPSPGAELAIIEKPQVYTSGAARKSDIIELAISAGEIGGRYISREYVLPSQWKGQLTKPVSHARIKKQLSAVELGLLKQWAKEKQGHLLDAIGIGLWYIKSKGLDRHETQKD